MTQTATPETGTVDAPASMDSILAELDTEQTSPDDAADEAVRELVEDAEEGDADEAADEGEQTEPADEEADEAPETGDDPTYKVKVNGEEVDVPLSELVKGYSREADYTRKTQALAEERKTIESRIAADYTTQLSKITDTFIQSDPILSTTLKMTPAAWQELAAADPGTYQQLRAQHDTRLMVLQEAQGELERGRQKAAAEQQERLVEQSRAEAEALVRAMPELSDDAKMKEFASENVGFLRQVGFADSEIAEVLDHKALLIINDARKWRAQQKAKAALPARKVIPASQAKPLKSDASQGSKSPRRPPSSNASIDDRTGWAVKELIDSL